MSEGEAHHGLVELRGNVKVGGLDDDVARGFHGCLRVNALPIYANGGGVSPCPSGYPPCTKFSGTIFLQGGRREIGFRFTQVIIAEQRRWPHAAYRQNREGRMVKNGSHPRQSTAHEKRARHT